LFHGQIVQQEATARASFRMTFDEQPCYHPKATPLMISRQGWNKSTFIQSLLPPELQWGYTNQLDVSEKRQTLSLPAADSC